MPRERALAEEVRVKLITNVVGQSGGRISSCTKHVERRKRRAICRMAGITTFACSAMVKREKDFVAW
jgi:hypothetical protein